MNLNNYKPSSYSKSTKSTCHTSQLSLRNLNINRAVIERTSIENLWKSGFLFCCDQRIHFGATVLINTDIHRSVDVAAISIRDVSCNC